MNRNRLNNGPDVRRFLLGEMAEGERTAFEEAFVADDAVFDEIRVAEDELIDAYVGGSLPAVDLAKFERNFLTSERRRERVHFMRTMLRRLSEEKGAVAAISTHYAAVTPTFLDSVRGFFKAPQMTFGAGLAILFVAFGGWLLLKNTNDQEISRQTSPTPLATIALNPNQQVSPNENDTVNVNVNKPDEIESNRIDLQKQTLNKNSNTEEKRTGPANPVLALFAGTSRSGGKTRELYLSQNSRTVSLQLNLETQDYKMYVAEIVTADGKMISKNSGVRPRNSKLNITVPAAKLSRGDYMVKLSAKGPQNEKESVADYTFRVNRK